jgi:hypothetical protein
MDIIIGFVSKNNIENDGNHCTRENNHSSKETFDRCMTIEHENIFCRCFIRYFIRKCFSNIFPDEKEHLYRMHTDELKTRITYCETHETKFDCAWI